MGAVARDGNSTIYGQSISIIHTIYCVYASFCNSSFFNTLIFMSILVQKAIPFCHDILLRDCLYGQMAFNGKITCGSLFGDKAAGTGFIQSAAAADRGVIDN